MDDRVERASVRLTIDGVVVEAAAGTSVAAVAPEPMTTTRLPV